LVAVALGVLQLGVLGRAVQDVVPPHVEVEEARIEVTDLLGHLLQLLQDEVREVVHFRHLLPQRVVVLELGRHHEVPAAAVVPVVALLHAADDLGGHAFPEQRAPALEVLEDDLVRPDGCCVVVVMMMAVVAVLFHVGGVCALAGVEDALPALVQDAGEVEGAVHLALRGVHVVPVQRVRGIVVGVDEADDVGDLVGAPEDEVGAREGQIGLADDAQQHPEGEDERNQARDLQDAREEPAAPLEPAASSPASLLFALSIAATEVLPVAAAAAAAVGCALDGVAGQRWLQSLKPWPSPPPSPMQTQLAAEERTAASAPRAAVCRETKSRRARRWLPLWLRSGGKQPPRKRRWRLCWLPWRVVALGGADAEADAEAEAEADCAYVRVHAGCCCCCWKKPLPPFVIRSWLLLLLLLMAAMQKPMEPMRRPSLQR